MFDMTRRTFLKASGALFAAPAIVKAENIMKIWTPPEKEIYMGRYENFRFVETPNFELVGTMPGDKVYVKDMVTGQVLINEKAGGGRFGAAIPENGHMLRIGIGRGTNLEYHNRIGAPQPGGRVKIRALGFLKNV